MSQGILWNFPVKPISPNWPLCCWCRQLGDPKLSLSGSSFVLSLTNTLFHHAPHRDGQEGVKRNSEAGVNFATALLSLQLYCSAEVCCTLTDSELTGTFSLRNLASFIFFFSAMMKTLRCGCRRFITPLLFLEDNKET